LFLPLLHNRDGDINQVDSRGRTLVHFAWHELLVRYLLEHGAPVPEGLRAPLLDALANPVGSKVFRANARPGYVDVDGRPVPAVMAFRGKDDPGFERCLRPVPNALVSQLASPMVVDGMASLGYKPADSVPAEAKAEAAGAAPPLIARFDATVEIVHARSWIPHASTFRACEIPKIATKNGSGRVPSA
jgi:hypothetical protein